MSPTHLHQSGIRRHIREALHVGVTREQIVEAIALTSLIGIHACAVGLPILDEELEALEHGSAAKTRETLGPTPVCDEFRKRGRFNPDWELVYELAPGWLERFLGMAAPFWSDGVLPLTWVELLCIAGDAAITHMYNPGTRRHIRAALKLGVTKEQIVQVLQIVAAQGTESYSTALPILEEECAERNEGVMAGS